MNKHFSIRFGALFSIALLSVSLASATARSEEKKEWLSTPAKVGAGVGCVLGGLAGVTAFVKLAQGFAPLSGRAPLSALTLIARGEGVVEYGAVGCGIGVAAGAVSGPAINDQIQKLRTPTAEERLRDDFSALAKESVRNDSAKNDSAGKAE